MSDSRLLLRRRSKGTILLAITFLLVSSLSGSVLAAKKTRVRKQRMRSRSRPKPRRLTKTTSLPWACNSSSTSGGSMTR